MSMSNEQDARMYIATLEEQERKRTGIRTLRIRWNVVDGYYIEITLAATSQRFREDPDWDIPEAYELIGNQPPNVHRFRTAELARNEAVVMRAQS